MMDDWSSAKLCDVANLILGMILFFSPWLFDLSNGVQWQAASTIGILIAVLSIAALAAFAVRWAHAHRIAMAPGFPGQRRREHRRRDRRLCRVTGGLRGVACPRHEAGSRKPLIAQPLRAAL
jgi:hypothetical protein